MFKALIVFLILFLLAVSIDLKPLDIKSASASNIHVTIKGAVAKEGVFELPVYASTKDLLEKAMPSYDADLSAINPETILKDGDILVIPEVSETTIQKININTAGIEELCMIQGIGESIAVRIIEYRNENGYFQTIEDIMRVKGIGEAKFEKMKESIAIA